MGSNTDPRGDQEFWDFENGVPYIGLPRPDVVTDNSEVWWDGCPYTALYNSNEVTDIYGSSGGNTSTSESVMNEIIDITTSTTGSTDCSLAIESRSAENRPNANKVFWDGASFDFLERGVDFGGTGYISMNVPFEGALYPRNPKYNSTSSGMQTKRSKSDANSSVKVVSAKQCPLRRKY